MNKYLIFLVYLVFGLYFVNYHFNYFDVPELMTTYSSWIIFLGGILILIASMKFLKEPHIPK
ncbi:MAG: hypothetical protein AABY03_01395 [Nanoarchaeota archaeon]